MRRTTLAAAVLLSTSSLALAANDGPRWFQQMDVNNDGVLTRAEAQAGNEAAFAGADFDRDQQVTAEEYGTYYRSMVGLEEVERDGTLTREDYRAATEGGAPIAPPRMGDLDFDRDDEVTHAEFDRWAEESFAQADFEPDEILTQEEWLAMSQGGFDEADSDRDEQLSSAEAATWYQLASAQSERTAAAMNGEGELETTPAQLTQAEADQQADAGLGMFDTDGDGYATLQEILAYNAQKFDQQDANGDGVLSPSEWDLRSQEHFGYRVNPEELNYQTESTFAEHDANGDNAVTRAEWKARIRDEFAAVDDNGDGQVDTSELAYHYIDIVPDDD